MDPINRYILKEIKSSLVMTVLNQNNTLIVYVVDVRHTLIPINDYLKI